VFFLRAFSSFPDRKLSPSANGTMTEFKAWIGQCHLQEIANGTEYRCLAAIHPGHLVEFGRKTDMGSPDAPDAPLIAAQYSFCPLLNKKPETTAWPPAL
tara:strand:- start:9987 stop:10283 length:297 start_codon:yes stop_codon:yes gene_type:complete